MSRRMSSCNSAESTHCAWQRSGEDGHGLQGLPQRKQATASRIATLAVNRAVKQAVTQPIQRVGDRFVAPLPPNVRLVLIPLDTQLMRAALTPLFPSRRDHLVDLARSVAVVLDLRAERRRGGAEVRETRLAPHSPTGGANVAHTKSLSAVAWLPGCPAVRAQRRPERWLAWQSAGGAAGAEGCCVAPPVESMSSWLKRHGAASVPQLIVLSPFRCQPPWPAGRAHVTPAWSGCAVPQSLVTETIIFIQRLYLAPALHSAIERAR